jgi:hypothetical protein
VSDAAAPGQAHMATADDAEQANACPACQQPAQAGWVFCGSCGAPLIQPTVVEPTDVPPTEELLGVRGQTDPTEVIDTFDLPPSAPSPPDGQSRGAVSDHNAWNWNSPPPRLPVPVAPSYPNPIAESTTVAHAASPMASTQHSWLRRQKVAVSVVLLLVAALAVLAVNDTGAHSQLSSTRRHLNQTAATLVATQGSLAATNTRLTSTQSALSTANSDKANLQQQLTSTQQELGGVRDTLSSTQSQLNLQAGQLSILKTCLSGVETSFSAVLSGNYSSALAAIDSVQAACQTANSLVNG